MTTTTATTITCDGCANGPRREVMTGYTIDGPPLGPRKWKLNNTLAKLGWKQFRKSSKGLRRDFCPDCVKAGRAK